MRGWRVGTISMGLLLILMGSLLLFGQINDISSIELIFKWWPAVLIMLGIEILLYVFLSRKEQLAVKYDGFSIFIIMLIIFSTLVAYGIKFLFDYEILIR